MTNHEAWQEFSGPAPQPWVPATYDTVEAASQVSDPVGVGEDSHPTVVLSQADLQEHRQLYDGAGTGADRDVAVEQPGSDVLLLLQDEVSRLRGDLGDVLAELQRVAGVAEHQSGLVDRLHTENERLRRAELDRLRDPFTLDLIALGDTSSRNARAWESRGGAGADEAAGALRDVAAEVTLILQRHGVDAYEPEPGTPFDRRDQRAAGSQDTADEQLVGTVAQVLRPGYRIGSRTLRIAEVVVWRRGSPETAPVQSAKSTAGDSSESSAVGPDGTAVGPEGDERDAVER